MIYHREVTWSAFQFQKITVATLREQGRGKENSTDDNNGSLCCFQSSGGTRWGLDQHRTGGDRDEDCRDARDTAGENHHQLASPEPEG